VLSVTKGDIMIRQLHGLMPSRIPNQFKFLKIRICSCKYKVIFSRMNGNLKDFENARVSSLQPEACLFLLLNDKARTHMLDKIDQTQILQSQDRRKLQRSST